MLKNKAGESRSPYVRAHRNNPVAWQVWGDEAIELARRENRLLFVSVGYSACHCEFCFSSFLFCAEEGGGVGSLLDMKVLGRVAD